MVRKALIIEDDPSLARLVKIHLSDIPCEADIATQGLEGLRRFEEGNYDLVVLDLMLPGMDGLSLCERIREKSVYVPILMLTARTSEEDRVAGLETGADDYLTKPFSVAELVARCKALFRRVDALAGGSADVPEQDILEHQGLHIDTGRRLVKVSGQEISLTAKEFDLLVHFARQPGKVFNRVQLLDQVWGYNHEGYEHTVNSHINRLRGKIESDPAKPRYILTVWGVGYKFAEETSS